MNIITLSYNDVFDDFRTVDVIRLISGIPSMNILQVAGHFSAQIHVGERDNERQLKLLEMWMGRMPAMYKRKIQDVIDEVRRAHDAKFNFIDQVSNCMLAELALENYNDLEMVSDLSPDQQLRLFKAYLYCSQLWINKQIFRGEDRSTPEGLSRLYIKLKFPHDEIRKLKDFRIQFVKAVFLFKFLEKNPIFKEFLDVFHAEHNVSSWNEYLSNLLSVYIRKFDEQKTPSVLEVADEHKITQEFLRQFCVNPTGFQATNDFLGLREKPVFELHPNEFLFLNLNFLVDKFFQGIQFVLAKALIKNKSLYKGKEIKRFDQFKSIYGEELSEKGLLYSIMDYVFANSGYIRFDGQALTAKLGGGSADYYLRDKNDVVLVEYKDILVNASTKHSYDFVLIKEEIFKKLVSNQVSSDKGVTQLVNGIERYRKGEYQKVDPDAAIDSIIYPVLIITDDTLNIAGVNFILNKEFQRLLAERGLDAARITDLTIVHFDTFLLLQDYIRSAKVSFIECLKEYNAMRRNPKNLTEAVAEFSEFMRYKMRSERDFTPKLLRDEVRGMIKD
jgi:hypothetical protein